MPFDFPTGPTIGQIVSGPNGVAWQWDGTKWVAVSSGSLLPSTVLPLMDGIAAIGTLSSYARGDHVHPTDTSLAPLASPAFTGDPTAPTAPANTSTNQLATTQFVTSAITAATAGVSSFNTRTGAVTLTSADITGAGGAATTSPAFTGTPTGPTAAQNTSTAQLATTAFVLAQASATTPIMDGTAAIGTATTFARANHVHPTDTSRAALASPAFTGTPTAPTASAGTNTTQLATTQFVASAITAGAFLPLAGGHMTGYMTAASGGASHPTQENFPTLDFLGGNITFQRQITNATGNEVGANPKVVVQLNNNCSNYTVQPWGGYDGPTAFFVNATNTPTSAGSVVATWSQITSQGNNNYTAQDTAHYVRVIRTGQNSCWGIAIQHQDNTGMPAQAFSTMGIENAMQINGPDDPRSYYNCTYSLRQGMSFIPSVNPTNTWAANTAFSKGIIVIGTPSGGTPTCYVAQNNGTTGATQPTWPTSGNVTDGTITWATGTAQACELGLAILIGGGRPQLPNTVINTGIGFNSPINNACIDTTLAVMNRPDSAAIRLAEGQIIDFTGGGSNANKNRRTLGYSDSISGMAMIMNNGIVVSQWNDDGTFIASHNLRLAGASNLSGVTQADSGSLTIGKNLAGRNEIDMIVGLADVINFYGTDVSGNISVPAPFITLGQNNSTFQGNLILNGLFTFGAGAATINSGIGAPTASRPVGSLYARTDGAIGATLYVSRGGGVWNPVAGV